MALKDITVTLRGSTARVVSVDLIPQPDGTTSLVAACSIDMSDGTVTTARVALTIAKGTVAMDNLMALVLDKFAGDKGVK